MKYTKHLIFGFLLLISNLSIAQNLKLSDIKGVWKSVKYEYNFQVFYEDSVASIGLRDNIEIVISFGKIGFMDENDPYLLKIDSIQNNLDNGDNPPLYIRVNLEDKDIKHLNIKNEKSKNGLFYFDGILSKLGIEDYPIHVGTRMEILNSNVHIYMKEQDLPALFIYKLLTKYPLNMLGKMLDKTFMKIISMKAMIYSNPNRATKMYLLKNDSVEVTEEKDNWLKIKYYPEKNGEWTGKTIEGWIKKSDVE
ncbi:SH3 domain-containing protein [Lacihabitans sp. CS3-21]|uniref:SH3 domain-containing protein n=1 Tax=Lacihabitans sp. CS3-21 TaxID=2487332 RepID=UPI0020CBE5B4|nr:SH3 domain-containing protein [Lacihabitans sp. CS3-21]MCP9745303.1 hypothetical protein [Lacihabitans sp. CS3-21]